MATKNEQPSKRASAGTTELPSMVAEESKTVPDGDHFGEIESVTFERRGDEGFAYIDVHVKEAETGVVLRAGYAANRVTNENDLGRLLQRFGWKWAKGKEADFGVLAGKVRFTTDTEKNKDGRFARIIRDTLRPA